MRRNRLEPAAQCRKIIEPIRRLRSRAGGRFGDERKSDGFGKRQRFIRVCDQLVPGTGHTSGPEDRSGINSVSVPSEIRPKAPTRTARKSPEAKHEKKNA